MVRDRSGTTADAILPKDAHWKCRGDPSFPPFWETFGIFLLLPAVLIVPFSLNFQFLRVGATVAPVCEKVMMLACLNTVYTLKCSLVFLTSPEAKRSLWN